MAAIIRNSFRVNMVAKFIESLAEDLGVPRNTFYCGIGRPQFWDVTGGNDNVVKTPENNVKSENTDWDDFIVMKRLNQSNVSHGIQNKKWVANRKYDAYRSDWNGTVAGISAVDGSFPLDISESDYYVITENYDIFICISNNSDPVTKVVPPSTQSPSLGTTVASTSPAVSFIATSHLYKTVDGYIWKKVARTASNDVVAFTTNDFHPVKTLTADPGIANYYIDQWTSQNDSKTHKAGIYNVVLNSKGAGVPHSGTKWIQNAVAGTEAVDGTGTPIVKVKGDGTGLQYVVIFGSGTIERIIITNPGSGYSYASFEVVGATTQPLYEIIFTPRYGLGADPVKDLSAFNLLVNVRLEYDAGTGTSDLYRRELPVTNEYRKIALIYNPLMAGTSNKASISYADQTYFMEVDSLSNFNDDDIVTGANGVKGRLVDKGTNPDGSFIRVIKTSEEGLGSTGSSLDFAVGGITSTSSGNTNITSVTTPDVGKGTGDVIYVDYRRPISRDISQAEDIKLAIEF